LTSRIRGPFFWFKLKILKPGFDFGGEPEGVAGFAEHSIGAWTKPMFTMNKYLVTEYLDLFREAKALLPGIMESACAYFEFGLAAFEINHDEMLSSWKKPRSVDGSYPIWGDCRLRLTAEAAEHFHALCRELRQTRNPAVEGQEKRSAEIRLCRPVCAGRGSAIRSAGPAIRATRHRSARSSQPGARRVRSRAWRC
jgi:hypothetical protein